MCLTSGDVALSTSGSVGRLIRGWICTLGNSSFVWTLSGKAEANGPSEGRSNAIQLLEARGRDAAAAPPLRDRSSELWVGDDDMDAILAGLFLMRIAA